MWTKYLNTVKLSSVININSTVTKSDINGDYYRLKWPEFKFTGHS